MCTALVKFGSTVPGAASMKIVPTRYQLTQALLDDAVASVDKAMFTAVGKGGAEFGVTISTADGFKDARRRDIVNIVGHGAGRVVVYPRCRRQRTQQDGPVPQGHIGCRVAQAPWRPRKRCGYCHGLGQQLQEGVRASHGRVPAHQLVTVHSAPSRPLARETGVAPCLCGYDQARPRRRQLCTRPRERPVVVSRKVDAASDADAHDDEGRRPPEFLWILVVYFHFWFVVSLGRMLGLLRYPFFSFFSFYFITKVSAALTGIWVLGTEVCFTAACQAVVLRPNRSPEVLGMKTNSGLSNDTVRLRLFLCNSFLINNGGRWPCQRIIQRIFALRVTYRTYSTYGTYGTQFTYFYNPGCKAFVHDDRLLLKFINHGWAAALGLVYQEQPSVCLRLQYGKREKRKKEKRPKNFGLFQK